MKRKKAKFEKGTEARRLARKSGLVPAATKIVMDKRKKPAKHRKNPLQEVEP